MVWKKNLRVYAGPVKENNPGCIKGSKGLIADCDSEDLSIQECEANTHLVAASRELYRVLEAVADGFREFPAFCAEGEALEVKNAVIEQIEKVLAQARGETSDE